jgi:hypothetical protein
VRDPGHKAGNLEKNVGKMAGANKLLKGYGKKIKKDWNWAIRQNREQDGGITGLHQKLKEIEHHRFYNSHEFCSHETCRFALFPQLEKFVQTKQFFKITTNKDKWLVGDIISLGDVNATLQLQISEGSV